MSKGFVIHRALRSVKRSAVTAKSTIGRESKNPLFCSIQGYVTSTLAKKE